MKTHSIDKDIKKLVLPIQKDFKFKKESTNLLGKKTKTPITQERQNKFKSIVLSSKISIISKMSNEPKTSLTNLNMISNSLKKSLSLQSNDSSSKNKNLSKAILKINKNNILNNSRTNTVFINKNIEKLESSNSKNIKPINRIAFNSKPKIPLVQKAKSNEKLIMSISKLKNNFTPIKEKKLNNDFPITSKNKSVSRNKSSIKANDFEKIIYLSENKQFNQNFDSANNNSRKKKTDNKDNSSKKFSRVSFIESASGLNDSSEKYIFKSSSAKKSRKEIDLENYATFSIKSSSTRKIKNSNKAQTLGSNSSKIYSIDDKLSGKKSKTKSFISNLSNEKFLNKSDKKSLRSIKDSVKKINFDDEAHKIEEKKNKIQKTSERKQKKIEYSRSRSISRSKEKRENINSSIKAFKPLQKFSNNPANNKTKSKINYSKVSSKVRDFLGNKFKKDMHEISNPKNEKTKLHFNEITKKDLQLYKQKKKIASAPLKDRKINEFKNNNIVNQRPKIKVESSLKKLFSENPLSKKTKDKKKTKKENTPNKTIGIIKNKKNEIIMSVNKSELFDNLETIKSASPKKSIKSPSKSKDFETEKKKIKLLISNHEINNLLNSMKSLKKESSSFKNNYLGIGKVGLDSMDFQLNELEEQQLSDDPLAQLNKNNLPIFSEGYLFQKYIFENDPEVANEENQESQNSKKLCINSQEILTASANKNDDQNLNIGSSNNNIKLIMSSKKVVTQKLTTAIKSSFKKRMPLDTELKLLSKEFRYLLSGKHDKAKETQNLLQEKLHAKKNIEGQMQECIEKKLDFQEKDIKMKTEQEIGEELKIQNDIQGDNSEYMYDNMDDEEIQDLENDILQKVLEENFGFRKFFPGQLETIKNTLNFKNTLTILPPGYGKSLCYQLPSLVLEGLTIVVCPLLASITGHLMNLPGCLSGASLTTFTDQNQRQEIMNGITLKKIKILFITPERFALENFTEIDDIEISLVCFDDAICCSPFSQNFRSSYISIISMLKKLKPNSVLLLGNNITNLVENSLLELFQIPRENVIKKKLEFPNNFRISVSKDENKLTNLVKLIRNSNIKSGGTILITCNLRKTVDKVTSFLNQNGLSASAYHAGKSEIERQLIQTNFVNDKIKILVITAGFCNGIIKSDIRYAIIFEMPPSIDMFYQELTRAGRDRKEAYVHVFLNDEDFFIQRNSIYLDNIDKASIKKFVENIFSKCHTKNHQYLFKNFNTIPSNNIEDNNLISNTINDKSNENKNNDTIENVNIDTNAIFQVINKEQEEITIKEENPKKKKTIYNLPKSISFNFNKVYERTGIKKNIQIFLLLRLLNDRKINSFEAVELTDGKLKAECLGIGPTDIHLRFFKRAPADIASEQPNLRVILETSRELTDGVFKFTTGEVCQKLGITYVDLINYLYCLQNEGEIGYETKDEGMFINIEKIPENMNDIIDYLYLSNKYLVNLNIKKLHASYSLLRKYAASSVDSFTFNKAEKSGSIRCLNIYNDYKSYEETFKKNFNLYFEIDENLCDILISGNENELEVLIPTVSIDSQREKANILKDIEDFVKKEYEKNFHVNSIELINVLIGINIESKTQFLSNPLWGKYQQHNYDDLLEIIETLLNKFKVENTGKNTICSQANKKKNK